MARITGVKAHTIRAWEKRYGLFNPMRCMLNIRSYGEKDLSLLKCIAVLKADGVKIGDIAEMTNDEIDHQAICCCQRREACSDHGDIIRSMIQNLDSDGFEFWLDKTFSELGAESAMISEIFPLLNKLRLLRVTGEISKIKCNVVDQIILRKLSSSIKSEKTSTFAKKSALLFFPQSQNPNACLLFLHYLLVSRGYKTLNIGSSYDLSEIKNLLNPSTPFNIIVTVLSEKFNVASAPEYITKLSKLAPESEIFVSGYQTKTLRNIQLDNLTIMEKLSDMVNIS